MSYPTSSLPRRSARIAAKVAKNARVAAHLRMAVARVTPATSVDPFQGLTPEQRVCAERIHKEGQERETLIWRWNTSMRDAVNDVRDKLNALFEPGSKGWWIAFEAHPSVQEWRRVGAELKEEATIWW